LVDEQARPVDVLAEGAELEMLEDADGRVGGAGAELLLVLDGTAPRSQIDAGAQLHFGVLGLISQAAKGFLDFRVVRRVVARVDHRREPAGPDVLTGPS